MSKKTKLLKAVLIIVDIALAIRTKRRNKNQPIHKDNHDDR